MIDRLLRKLKFVIQRSAIGSLGGLQKRTPFNALKPEIVEQERIWLAPYHQDYVSEVSRADMAVSLELASLVSALCRVLRPARLLDFGSGFSSFVLRTYARNHPGVIVTSVDDDDDWLERTRSFLREHQLETADAWSLKAFLSNISDSFDFILFDLNFVEVRIGYVRQVVERLSSGGVIIFDDVHKTDYLMQLLPLLLKLRISVFSLKKLTLDQYGRYALVAIKP